MKKFIYALLVLSLMVAFVACGGNNQDDTTATVGLAGATREALDTGRMAVSIADKLLNNEISIDEAINKLGALPSIETEGDDDNAIIREHIAILNIWILLHKATVYMEVYQSNDIYLLESVTYTFFESENHVHFLESRNRLAEGVGISEHFSDWGR